MALEKLTISKIQHKNQNGSYEVSRETFTCQFNPTEFEIGKSNHWVSKPNIGSDAEQLTFTGGGAQDITLKLLFDSTDSGEPVTKHYQILKSLTLVDPQTRDRSHTGKGEPPWVHVQWGRFIAFPAVITTFTERYILFTPDGAPLRAEVSVTLKQATDSNQKQGQNPTSLSEPRRTWVVQQGERLDWIAYEEYGDANAWRRIADANNLLDPKRLHAGQVLRLTKVA